MFECGTYEYGLKTGDLPEKEMVKIFERYSVKLPGKLMIPAFPKGGN